LAATLVFPRQATAGICKSPASLSDDETLILRGAIGNLRLKYFKMKYHSASTCEFFLQSAGSANGSGSQSNNGGGAGTG